MDEEGGEHEQRAAFGAAAALVAVAKAREKLRRAERFRFFDRSLAECGAGLVEASRLARAVEPVAAHSLQPRHGMCAR